MSRSYKKVLGGGFTTSPSDKWFKTAEHRRFRRAVHNLISHGEEDIFPDYGGTFGNPWSSPKDGKVVWHWSINSYLRNTVICNVSRTGEYYTPSWAKHPIRRQVVSERPAHRGDWKKAVGK